MANIYLGNTQLGGGGIVPTNTLPTANAENYDKHELYLNDGELKYLDAVEPDEPSAETKNSNIRYCVGGSYGYTNGKIYRFGGQDSASPTQTNKISYYDIENNSETIVDEVLPVSLAHSTCVQKDNYVYLFGGQTTSSGSTAVSTIYKINLNNLEISKLDATVPRYSHQASCKVNDKVYIFGGNQFESGSWYYNSNITMFDLLAETKTTIGTMTTGNYGMATANIGNNVYIIGGRQDKNIYVYDTINLTYTKVWNYNLTLTTFAYYSAIAYGGKIYILGGAENKNNIYSFDTTSNTITTLNVTLDANLTDYQYTPAVEQIDDETIYVLSQTFAFKLSFAPIYEYKTLASSDVVNTISFTITFTSPTSYTGTYQATEGMTWSEWVNSAYNTGSYEVYGTTIRRVTGAGTHTIDGATPSGTITNGRTYSTTFTSGGNND